MYEDNTIVKTEMWGKYPWDNDPSSNVPIKNATRGHRQIYFDIKIISVETTCDRCGKRYKSNQGLREHIVEGTWWTEIQLWAMWKRVHV